MYLFNKYNTDSILRGWVASYYWSVAQAIDRPVYTNFYNNYAYDEVQVTNWIETYRQILSFEEDEIFNDLYFLLLKFEAGQLEEKKFLKKMANKLNCNKKELITTKKVVNYQKTEKKRKRKNEQRRKRYKDVKH